VVDLDRLTRRYVHVAQFDWTNYFLVQLENGLLTAMVDGMNDFIPPESLRTKFYYFRKLNEVI